MSLQLDPSTGKITYRGKEVGEHIFKDGRSTVRLNIEYEGDDDWIVPLSWFTHGLSMLADNWPSPLHGHDYDKGLKLDAITGGIYDVGTRERCKTLKAGDLQAVQAELRASKDFKEVVATLIDNPPVTTGPT